MKVEAEVSTVWKCLIVGGTVDQWLVLGVGQNTDTAIYCRHDY